MSSTSNSASQPAGPGNAGSNALLVVALIAIAGISLGVLFRAGLENMYQMWHQPEYNHGFMIPLVAIYLVWLRARAISAAPLSGSWLGIGLLLVSLALLFLGDRSSVFALTQYAFVLALWALVYAAGGTRGIRLMWVPLLYLAFMVPLPDMITQKLTAGLQLISSQIGVAVIRAAGLSVYLEGNVIDLGSYQLQVAEACSGMRYLFPLMSFGFLCAVLFRGRWWQKAILFFVTIPLTILMNSFRIGVIGILVNFYGIEQAEGFLHDFEGWVIFMACVGVLFSIIWVFARMEKRPFLEIFGLDIPEVGDLGQLVTRLKPSRPILIATVLLVVAAAASLNTTRQPLLVPERASLATLPLQFGAWAGREEAVEQIFLDELKTSDYLMALFSRPSDLAPVGLWVAYYDNQTKGVAVHSPQACLPGGGWRIKELTEHEIQGVGPDGGPLRVNRAEIALGEDRQLVYYWFAQRGRNLTSEYLVKWYIFQDGLTMNRTDGALVRVTTPIAGEEELADGDARLEAFIRDIDPKLAYYLPGSDAVPRASSGVLGLSSAAAGAATR